MIRTVLVRRLLFVLAACVVINARAADSTAVPSALRERASEMVDALTRGQYEHARGMFDKTMLDVVSLVKLRDTWDNITGKTGAFKSIVGERTEVQGNYRIVYVSCAFEQGNFDVKVVFDHEGLIAGFFMMPTRPIDMYATAPYVTPDAFREIPVSLGEKPYILHGTLDVPRAGNHHPVVILVHGSGPQDRDESVGPNKPFRDLAEGLASRGIAVLRYEKRTHEHASRMFAIQDQITVRNETIEDVWHAVKMLRGREEIDPHRIIVLGHSLGGYLMPRIAQGQDHIAGCIVMAGSARPLEDLVLDQYTYLCADTTVDTVRTILERIRNQVAQVKSPSFNASTPASYLPLSLPAAYWLDLKGYDPASMAVSLPQPMLFLQGGRDYQVTQKDWAVWKKALAHRTDVRFTWYDNLNHLFMPGTGVPTPAEYEESGHVAEPVVEEIARWVKERVAH